MVTIRLYAVAILLVGFLWVGGKYSHPVVPLAAAIAVTGESAIVIAWWLRGGIIRRSWLWLEIPMNLVALVLDAWQTPTAVITTWTFVLFPYTTILALSLGIACRRLYGSVLAGVPWLLGFLAATVGLHHVRWSDAMPSAIMYLANPVLGFFTSRLVLRGAAELRVAEQVAIEQGVMLGRSRERARQERMLHDRVLQTLETLGRAEWIVDAGLRERATADAVWLRNVLETGHLDDGDELLFGLEAVGTVAQRSGLIVELTVAGVRPVPTQTGAASIADNAIVTAVHEILTALACSTKHVTLHAERQSDGALVTVLGGGKGSMKIPDQELVDSARHRIERVGGTLLYQPLPYFEVWLPSAPSNA